MRLMTLLSLRPGAPRQGRRDTLCLHNARTFRNSRELGWKPLGAGVLDPAVLTDEKFRPHRRRGQPKLKCGLLLYGSLSPGCTRFLVTWSDRLIVDMYFPDRESDGALLSLKLLAMRGPDCLRTVAQCGRATRWLAAAPDPRGLVGLFGTLPVPPSAEHFSRSISVPRKTLDRWMIRWGSMQRSRHRKGDSPCMGMGPHSRRGRWLARPHRIAMRVRVGPRCGVCAAHAVDSSLRASRRAADRRTSCCREFVCRALR